MSNAYLTSSRHLLILALRFLSSRGLVIFLYWCVLDIGTSDGLVSLGELENPDKDNFCSGDDSVEEVPESGPAPIMVVELTRGEKAENGDCQFMAGAQCSYLHTSRWS